MNGQDFSDLWLPKIVGQRLVDSLKIINLTAGPTGPAGFGTSMPRELMEAAGKRASDGVSEWWEWESATSSSVRRSFSARRVTEADDEVLWPWRYLKDEPAPPGSDLRPLRVLNVHLFCKQMRGFPFDAACKSLGWSRGTAYRARGRALSVIAQGLNRDKVPVPR